VSDDDLRAAEREALEHPSGAALSRLAFELARASRPDDAFRAAVRATAHDPAAPARALFAPCWTEGRGGLLDHAVTWPGLTRLGRVRVLEGVPGGSLSSIVGTFVDLGRGLVAYTSGGEGLVVDVLGGRVLRRFERHQPFAAHDGDLVAMTTDHDGKLVIERLDWSSGASRAAIPLGFRVAKHTYLADHRFIVQQLDHEDSPRARGEPERGVVHTFDLRTGERIARFELPPLHLSDLDRAGDSILVLDGDSPSGEPIVCRAFDLHGRELWSMQDAVPEGFVDGRVLYSPLDDAEDFEPAVTGSPPPLVPTRGAVYSLGVDVVATTDGEETEILDRRTLERLWGVRHDQRRYSVVAQAVLTRDTLLRVESDGMGESGDELVSFDARSGAERSRVPLGTLPPNAAAVDDRSRRSCALVAGRAVVGTTRGVEAPLIVVEDVDVA